MSTPAQKKRKKAAAKSASPALSTASTSAPSPAAAAPTAIRAPPLSAIAARRAAAALLAAASRPPTPPPVLAEETERDLQEDEDRRARALIADAAVDEDDGHGDGRVDLAADHVAFGEEEDESSDAYGSSEGEGEDITLQMDGEVISLGSVPRPSKSSTRRRSKPPKGKGREDRISKLEASGAGEALGDSSIHYQSMEVDTPQRSTYGASASGTPSVADSRLPKKRKGYQCVAVSLPPVRCGYC